MHYQNNDSILLTQSKYIKYLLNKVNMACANGVTTPMFIHFKLCKHGSDVLADPSMYRSIIWALQYVTHTCPDITFCVNKACQLLFALLHSNWSLVKWTTQYLNGTITYGVLLSPENPLTHISLRANNNFDRASDPDDRRLTSGNPDDKRSTSGTCIYLYPNLM